MADRTYEGAESRPVEVDFDPKEHLNFALRLKFFRGMHRKEVAHILKQGRLLEYPARSTIFHEGSQGENLFVVFDGRVNIYSAGAFIAVCREGDVFGELSALDHGVHSASAVANKETTLFTISEQQLHDMLGETFVARFLLNIIREVHGLLRQSNAEITRLRRELASKDEGA